MTTDERFDNKLMPEPNTGCLLYTGITTDRGYGQFRIKRVRIAAHKFAYERVYGPVPEGLELHHICHQRICCEVNHLVPLTRFDHAQVHKLSR